MKEVSADKGYLGAENMLAILQHGAIPYIPFKISGSIGLEAEITALDADVSLLQLARLNECTKISK